MYISRPTSKPKPKEEECLIVVTDPDQPTTQTSVKSTVGVDIVVPASVLPPLPNFVINEKTMIFRMDSRTLWTRYSLGMINYSVSSFGNLGSTPNVEKNLARAASAIGDFFVPYYGIKAGTKIGSLLIVISNNGTKVVEAIKNKRDISPYKNIWNKQIDELAGYLNELNPSQYPTDLLSEQFTSLVDFWTVDFQARYEEDFVTDSITLDSILKVAVSGIADHANKGYSSIADILSRGIIAQYPGSFLE